MAITATGNSVQDTGTFTATGTSTSFLVDNTRDFNVTLYGTFAATVRLERTFDGGVNWHPITANGTALYVWTAPVSESNGESQRGVSYRLNCTVYTSGTVNYRVSQ